MSRGDFEIILEGARRSFSKGSDGLALARFYFDELARFLVCGCDEVEDFLIKCRESFEKITENGVSPLVRGALVSHLCRSAIKYFDESGKNVSVCDFFKGEELDSGRITYVKNANSDEAYRVFSGVVENASVIYSGSFVSACEEVYYGRVAYCILPYETSEEGTLSGFMKLIRKYELYPHYVCSCGSEGALTRFALFGRSPNVSAIDVSESAYLKLTFYRPEQDTLLRLSASQLELSIRPVKTDSFPVSFEDGAYGIDVTVYGKVSELLPFLLYTELEIPECSDKAIYRQIY